MTLQERIAKIKELADQIKPLLDKELFNISIYDFREHSLICSPKFKEELESIGYKFQQTEFEHGICQLVTTDGLSFGMWRNK